MHTPLGSRRQRRSASRCRIDDGFQFGRSDATRYNVPYFEQAGPETCWYAAARMIFAFSREEMPLVYTPNFLIPLPRL